MIIPFYLQEKLNYFGINSNTNLTKENYTKVFAWIKDMYPSTGYKALYDLYALVYNLPLGSLDALLKKQVRQGYLEILPCYTPLENQEITKYLKLAEHEATKAAAIDEIPVGAVVVKDKHIIGSGFNRTRFANNITQHAEIVAMSLAKQNLGQLYLEGCDLYITIEPCLMCSGAIIANRLKRVIFGAVEPKTGAVISQYKVFANRLVNHHTEVIGPIDTLHYSKLLSGFLRSKR